MKVSRRTLLSGAVAAAAISGRVRRKRRRRPIRPKCAAGRRVPSDSAPAPSRCSATAEPGTQPARRTRISAASSRRPTCTSSGTTAACPRSIRRRYSLLIHGMVERPTVFTLADLKRFPSVSRIHFLECSGNLGRTAGPETKPGQLAGLTSTSEWTGVPLATLFREVGASPEGDVVPRRGQRRRGDDAQRPGREGVRRRADRVRAERRADAARAGLSGAAVSARLGRQREREVAAPHRAVGSAVHDARGDVEVHRAVRQRHGADVQLRDGCALADHLSGLSGDAEPRLGRDQRHRVDRVGPHRARRREHRWRQDLDGGDAAGAGAAEGAHALPASLAMDRRRGRAS